MTVVNIYKAKTNLSELVKRVVKGEVIIIGKAGDPLVQMVPYREQKPSRKPGAWKGKVKIEKGFDRLSKSILKAFNE